MSAEILLGAVNGAWLAATVADLEAGIDPNDAFEAEWRQIGGKVCST